MKRIILLLSLIACIWPQTAAAQNRREIVFTIGTPGDKQIMEPVNDTYAWDLYSGYEPRFVQNGFGPILGIQYQQFVSKRINVGVMGAWAMNVDRLYEPIEREYSDRRDLHYFCLLAQARYYYKYEGDWQFYSGLGLGGNLSATFLNEKRQSLKPGLAYEAVLFGVREGIIVPVFAELIYGNTAIGARFGIGFTF